MQIFAHCYSWRPAFCLFFLVMSDDHFFLQIVVSNNNPPCHFFILITIPLFSQFTPTKPKDIQFAFVHWSEKYTHNGGAVFIVTLNFWIPSLRLKLKLLNSILPTWKVEMGLLMSAFTASPVKPWTCQGCRRQAWNVYQIQNLRI